MDDAKLGRLLRALRRRRGWRQADLGAAAGCTQSLISLVERGHLETLSVRQLRRIARPLDARLDAQLSWRGGSADRLVDAAHAALVEIACHRLGRLGWDPQVEVTYSRFGERGSIDVLAARSSDLAAVVAEMKTEIVAVEELIRRHDQKARLASQVCQERFGWRPTRTMKLLVVPEDRTIRRVLDRHSETFRTAYPMRNVEVRRWLSDPSGTGDAHPGQGRAAAGVWFLTGITPSGPRRGAVRPATAVGERSRSRTDIESRRGGQILAR